MSVSSLGGSAIFAHRSVLLVFFPYLNARAHKKNTTG